MLVTVNEMSAFELVDGKAFGREGRRCCCVGIAEVEYWMITRVKRLGRATGYALG